jgi:hypothetical protein
MAIEDTSLNLHVGDWVEVKSADEILGTLDNRQSVDRLPFMPEMLQYCGKRFRVFKSAHKTADTTDLFVIQRMKGAVHLEGLRCDGTAHGGCQARCLLFWKTSWLKRVHSEGMDPKRDARASISPQQSQQISTAREILTQATRHPVADGEPERYRCQATEMPLATTPVRRRDRWDPRFYVQDLTSGNVKPLDFIRFGALGMLNAFLKRWFGFYLPRVRGLAGEKTPSQALNLQPGERVRVKSKREVMLTLNKGQRNRGMWFDAEMVPYCGKSNFRVLHRVDRLIHEKTGQMLVMTNPCIILDGVTCSGNYLYQRMFSPKHEYMYFREIWLERIDPAKVAPPAADYDAI